MERLLDDLEQCCSKSLPGLSTVDMSQSPHRQGKGAGKGEDAQNGEEGGGGDGGLSPCIHTD